MGAEVDTFDIFRKYIVGDITLLRHDKNTYTFDNFIPKIKDSVRRFNKFVVKLIRHFEILVGKHKETYQNYIISNRMVKNNLYRLYNVR